MSEHEQGADRSPFTDHVESVRPEWVDYNDHMNVAYYVLVFDHATDAVLEQLDLGEAYRRRTGCSVFVGEAHVTYDREVRAGERLRVASRVLGFDGKRIVLYHEMARDGGGGVVASNEVLCLHVDLGTRRTASWPPDVADRVRQAADRDARRPRPPRAGRSIALDGRRPR
ncbi:MAG: thioesterase family protein [Rhodospirillales bacterium]